MRCSTLAQLKLRHPLQPRLQSYRPLKEIQSLRSEGITIERNMYRKKSSPLRAHVCSHLFARRSQSFRGPFLFAQQLAGQNTVTNFFLDVFERCLCFGPCTSAPSFGGGRRPAKTRTRDRTPNPLLSSLATAFLERTTCRAKVFTS